MERTPDWKTDSLMDAGAGVLSVAIVGTSSVGSDLVVTVASSADSEAVVAVVVATTTALVSMSCTASGGEPSLPVSVLRRCVCSEVAFLIDL
jgi:hypothetical protein